MSPSETLRVVLSGGSATGIPWLRERLRNIELIPVPDGDALALRTALRDAHAVVCANLTARDTAEAGCLLLVHVLGAGWDGIAEDALPPGCTLCNVFEHETAISEWILMSMLSLTRRLLVYDREIRRGVWHEAVSFSGIPERDLRGRTVGMIGLGHIGSRTAELARAMGMRTIAITRTPSRERAAKHGIDWLAGMADLHRLLTESDFAVVCIPLTPETEGLIGPVELRLLGPQGYLVNVARGPIVRERPFYEALRDGTIKGAAIDVWYRYPSRVGETVLPASCPFWELDNVIMTPHSAGWSDSTLDGRWRFIAEQLARLTEGRALQNVVRQVAREDSTSSSGSASR